MMQIPTEHLATLVAVVDAGTFDGAAKRLSITPSAVSQRIKALEQRLGRVLVVRSRPVRVTSDAEVLVRLGRQRELLERETLGSLGLGEATASVRIPVAVNADSLEGWLIPALVAATSAQLMSVELTRADQDRTAELLSSGTVMAAITSQSRPVPGCRVVPLGAMRYRPVASREFIARWFPGGVSADALAAAPIVEFDRDDELQRRYLRRVTRRRMDPPRHVIPASSEFARAVSLGLGWGMLPDAQVREHADVLVELDRSAEIAVPLFWQQWDLRSSALDALAGAVREAARTALAPVRP